MAQHLKQVCELLTKPKGFVRIQHVRSRYTTGSGIPATFRTFGRSKVHKLIKRTVEDDGSHILFIGNSF